MLQKMMMQTTVVLIILLVSLSCSGQAAESWVSDPKSGAKIGFIHEFYTITAGSWSGPVAEGKAEGKGILSLTLLGLDNKQYVGQAEGDMMAGLFNGRVTMKFTDGDTFDGMFVNGIIEGNGTYYFADRNRIYSGEYKNNLPEGYGVYKEASGKVLYEGQWIDGNPATRPMLDKVLGIPWGATEEEVKKTILARPRTSLRGTAKVNAHITEHQYWGPFNDIDQWILFRFYDGKMYLAGMVQQFADNKLDLLMERYDMARKGLMERYGPADIEKGKYIDAKLAWAWSGKYAAVLSAERMATTTPPSFILRLAYFEGKTYYKAESGTASSGHSEY